VVGITFVFVMVLLFDHMVEIGTNRADAIVRAGRAKRGKPTGE
jgi:hypothetical protein